MAYVGEIRMFAGHFAPKGWALCDGSMLPVAEHEALFSLISTIYGGDGVSTFALPDLRGRGPVHRGQGPGLSPCTMGQAGGAETVTLSVAQTAAHTHTAHGASAPGTATAPAGNVWAANAAVKQFAAGSAAGDPMAGAAIGPTGGGQPHENMAPFLAVNFIIRLDSGDYPNRP